MKSRTLVCVTAMTLFAALSASVRQAAQGQTTHFRHYKLIDIGTFGGPASFVNPTFNAVPALNSHGTLVGASGTAVPTTSTSDFFVCGGGEGDLPNVFHAFKWQNGSITDLGAFAPRKTNCSNAVSVNEKGEIVGISEIDKIDPNFGVKELRGVLWKDGALINLGTLGGNETIVTGINNRTQVVGEATNNIPDPFGLGTQLRAFLWQQGVMQDLGTLGGNDAGAEFINERGQVEGFSFTDSTPNATTGLPTGHPFLWTNGEMRDLGSLGGTLAGFGGANQQGALNNRGQVIGLSNLPGDQTADPFLWDGEQMIDLNTHTIGGNPESANALNDAGEIVGTAAFSGRPFSDAYLWRKGVATDLGAVEDDCFSEASAINSRRQIVGLSFSCASNVLRTFLWENGSIVDLNALSSPNSLQLIDAAAINDHGEIGGVGVPPGCSDFTDTECGHAFLLIPVCANGNEGCADAPLDPAVVARSRAASGAAPKTMTAEELAKFKERIARMHAGMTHRNRGFGFWPRR
jgi:probable HAF family extracellular repeat protein